MAISWKYVVQAAGVCAITNAALALPILDDGNIHTVMINYVPGELTVYVDDMLMPQMTIPIDLRDVGEPGMGILDTSGRAWVGFTAGAAGASTHQDILSWRLEPARLSHTERAPAPAPGFILNDFKSTPMIILRGEAEQTDGRLRVMPADAGNLTPAHVPLLDNWFSAEDISPIGSASAATKCMMPTNQLARSAAWYALPQHLEQGFATVFEFQMTKTTGDQADGFAFVIQNQSTDALGGDGSEGMGYWDGQQIGQHIAPAIAIEFDTYADAADPNGPGHPCGCTHDPANHLSINATVAPAMFYSVDALSDQLVLIDADTGIVTPIGPVGFDAHKVDLVVAGARLYAVNSDPAGPEMLYVLDHLTGNGVPIGDVNLAGTPIELLKGLGARPDGTLVAAFGDTGQAYRIGRMYFDGTIITNTDLYLSGAPNPDIDALAFSREGRLMAADSDLTLPVENVRFVDLGTHPPRFDVVSVIPATPEMRSVDDMMFANATVYGIDWEIGGVHRFDPLAGSIIASVPIDPGYQFGALTLAPSTLCTADIDYDNDVDVLDFTALIDGFGDVGLIPFTGGDVTGDGTVNVLDFARLASSYGCGT